MTTILVTHESCIDHDPGPMHPESPARLQAVLTALSSEEFSSLERYEAPKADIETIARIHPQPLVEEVLDRVALEGRVMIDGDTHLSAKSGESARRAVGAVCRAVDLVMNGEANNAFCAVRPPGHHAEPQTPMGFCIFNNVAAGAEQARKIHGAEKVAVVDFDVHHGNGTQSIFWNDSNLFLGSTHQMPLYPGTGSKAETGKNHNIVNVPLAPNSNGEVFRSGMESFVLPALRKFNPDLILISAGFDAHKDDPLAQLNLIEEDYIWITNEIMSIAADSCDGRVVSTLEGGYNLVALANSVASHVRSMMS